jgi:hypothetical protein
MLMPRRNVEILDLTQMKDTRSGFLGYLLLEIAQRRMRLWPEAKR